MMTEQKAEKTEPASLPERLCHKAISAVSAFGLEAITLRAIAASADVSTSAIVHHFGNKDGLLLRAMAVGKAEDEAFHRDFLDQIAGLEVNSDTLIDVLLFYLQSRRASDVSRFWAEILFKSRDVKGARPHLSEWVRNRRSFWCALSDRFAASPEFCEFIDAYMLMEEVFGFGLTHFAQYEMLARETLRAALAFNEDATRFSLVSTWLNRLPTNFGIAPVADPESLPNRLLEHAADDIIAGSISSVNQREITSRAKSSSSMIVYHFGDMETFVREAIWRALLRNVPREIDANDRTLVREDTIEDWARTLSGMIQPGSDTSASGYYVNYARTVGQTSLLAVREPALRPLVEHVRIIEGFGSYLAGQSIWPKSISFDRGHAAAFAMWIKGRAILNEAIDQDRPAGETALIAAGRLMNAGAAAAPAQTGTAAARRR